MADAIELIRGQLRKLRQELWRHERFCGRTLEQLERIEDALEQLATTTGAKGVGIAVRRGGSGRRPPVLWFASKVILATSGPSQFVVGGTTYEATIKGFELDLLRVLKHSKLINDETRERRKSPDHLVAFWTGREIAEELRKRYKRTTVTARSVTVGIERLRKTLGPTYRDLVETRSGEGYRLRVLQT